MGFTASDKGWIDNEVLEIRPLRETPLPMAGSQAVAE